MNPPDQPRKRFPRWPLAFLASPAAVAIWSGWVGLAGLCGFGIIHPLPGIVPDFQINTSVTLAVGMEAYAAYALGAWLGPWPVPAGARTFAKRSALGALVLGAAGQVIFHLLSAAHAKAAPWPVVMLVACMPIGVVGLGSALVHLMRQPAETPGAPERSGGVPADVVAAAKASFAATVAAGNPWSQNQLVTKFGLTRAVAAEIALDVTAAVIPPAAAVTLNGSARNG